VVLLRKIFPQKSYLNSAVYRGVIQKKEVTLASPPLTSREYAYFSVTGEGSSEAVTSILKIEPTNQWSQGELNPRNNQPRKFMRWNLESGLDDTHPISAHIEKLLEILEPYQSELSELSKHYEVYIQCAGYFPCSGHGLNVSRNLIEKLYNLSLSLDYDFYFVEDYGHDLDYH
jgi:hypothetical protein